MSGVARLALITFISFLANVHLAVSGYPAFPADHPTELCRALLAEGVSIIELAVEKYFEIAGYNPVDLGSSEWSRAEQVGVELAAGWNVAKKAQFSDFAKIYWLHFENYPSGDAVSRSRSKILELNEVMSVPIEISDFRFLNIEISPQFAFSGFTSDFIGLGGRFGSGARSQSGPRGSQSGDGANPESELRIIGLPLASVCTLARYRSIFAAFVGISIGVLGMIGLGRLLFGNDCRLIGPLGLPGNWPIPRVIGGFMILWSYGVLHYGEGLLAWFRTCG
ncbi:hypothetical protein [Methylocystis sp. B8]|uniref:hypothetical protein n=1 Tax=Methylocystis sp. B8 TaxID=544938 RepID=UPI0010FF6212|nr:hypothetical protein [Methylocystis sp. B8]TLG78000.1 hypothetical protein FEV16_05380 [Methylocystis sp. B8]